MRTAYLLVLTLLPAVGQDYTIKALSRHPLTNESIITLANAGFDELFIIERIQTSRTNFSMNVDDLVALKKAGVSEDLIRVMLAPGPSSGVMQTAKPVQPASASGPAPAAELTMAALPPAEEPLKSVENKWWTFHWARIPRIICR